MTVKSLNDYEKEIQLRVEQELERRLKDPFFVIESYQKVIAIQNTKIEALLPKAEFFDVVTQSDDWVEMSAAVKLLGIKGWGRNNTFQFLRDRGVLRHNNEPYQQYVDRGYFKIVEQHFSNPQTGETMVNRKPVVSQKGIDFIRRIIME